MGILFYLPWDVAFKADMAVRPTYYANVGGTLFMAQLLFFPTHSHPTHKLTQYILVRMIRPLVWLSRLRSVKSFRYWCKHGVTYREVRQAKL